MRVFVTGATGFLGGALAHRLHADGHHIIAHGRDPTKLAQLPADETIAGDLSALAQHTTPIDALVHCAALSSPWGRRADFIAANIGGTRAALDFAQRAGARRFVHISTPSLYFRFADQLSVREDASLPPPVNAYSETKRAAEALVLAAEALDPIILRPRGLYGAGDTSLVPRLLAAARARPLPLMNEGRAATDLTHVDDAVAAIVAALDAPSQLKQRVFNISGGVALNVRAVAEAAAAKAGIVLRWRPAPVALVLAYARASEALCAALPHRPEPPITAYGAGLFAYTQTLDVSAAHAHLGWTPRISFDDGLERTFARQAA